MMVTTGCNFFNKKFACSGLITPVDCAIAITALARIKKAKKRLLVQYSCSSFFRGWLIDWIKCRPISNRLLRILHDRSGFAVGVKPSSTHFWGLIVKRDHLIFFDIKVFHAIHGKSFEGCINRKGCLSKKSPNTLLSFFQLIPYQFTDSKLTRWVNRWFIAKTHQSIISPIALRLASSWYRYESKLSRIRIDRSDLPPFAFKMAAWKRRIIHFEFEAHQSA